MCKKESEQFENIEHYKIHLWGEFWNKRQRWKKLKNTLPSSNHFEYIPIEKFYNGNSKRQSF